MASKDFLKNAPPVALVLFVAEAIGVADSWLRPAVATFFVVRVNHTIRHDRKERALGMTLTNSPAFGIGVSIFLQANGLL